MKGKYDKNIENPLFFVYATGSFAKGATRLQEWGMLIVFSVLHDRNDRYRKSFLSFIVLCILSICAVNEKPESAIISCSDSASIRSIALPGNEFYDFVSDEITGRSVIKSVVSKKPVIGRSAGFGAPLTGVVVRDLFILIGLCALFLLYCDKALATTHHFIITYIHNLDGMKP